MLEQGALCKMVAQGKEFGLGGYLGLKCIVSLSSVGAWHAATNIRRKSDYGAAVRGAPLG